MPYMLSRYQYGIPTTFTFQPNPAPHTALSQEQQVDYDMQSEVHGHGTDTVGQLSVRRLADRVRFYRFFFLAPLYLALPLFLLSLRESAISLGRLWPRDLRPGHQFLSLLLSALHCGGRLPAGAGRGNARSSG